MAVLPTELVIEILSKLPVKTLLCFLCVCKSWNSLIKTPNFINVHLNQTLLSNSDRHLLLFYPSLRSAELDDLHFNQLSFSEIHHPLQPHNLSLFGSCNGIVCLSDILNDGVVLFNPLTKSHRKLKLPSVSISADYIVKFEWFGFGYDSGNDDYKILRMVQKHKNDTIFSNEAKVYSLNNNSWKCVQGIPYYLFYKDFHGVLVNEVLHFIVTKELDFQCQLIACFNLRTESFSYMECTGYEKELMRTERLLSELGGCLCVVVTYHVRDSCIMEEADFWVMNEYGNKESWVRLFSISLPGSIGAYLQIKPLVYSRDERRVLLEIDSLRLVWYDLKSNKVDGCCKAHGLPDGALEMTKFSGSLVSLEVEDKLGQEKGTLPRKNKIKNDLDNYLSVGFKLRL